MSISAVSAPLPIGGLESSSDIQSDDTESSDKGPVEVPRIDNETFQDFFQTKTVEELSAEKVKVTLDDFDHVFMKSYDM